MAPGPAQTGRAYRAGLPARTAVLPQKWGAWPGRYPAPGVPMTPPYPLCSSRAPVKAITLLDLRGRGPGAMGGRGAVAPRGPGDAGPLLASGSPCDPSPPPPPRPRGARKGGGGLAQGLGKNGGALGPKRVCTDNGPIRFSQRSISFVPTTVTLVGGGD